MTADHEIVPVEGTAPGGIDIPRLREWLQSAPPGEVAATRDETLRRAAYLRGRDRAECVAHLMAARVCEWEMAQRWPAGNGARQAERPVLEASHTARDAEAWNRIYAVGAQPLDWIMSRTEPEELTQAAIIRGPQSAHVANNSGRNEWYTPPAYIEAARDVLGHIALDPASSAVAQLTVKASVFFTAEDDGLAHDWFGPIWLNPPYAQPLIGQFISKLCNTEAEAIVLVNNGTETEWGQQLLGRASAACFPAGRIRFLDPEGNLGAPLQGQMVAYIGQNPDMFAAQFKAFGPVLRP